MKKEKYDAVFISDTHLGTRGCKDKALLAFLHSFDSDYLFLVGDIIDGWRLKSSFYWSETHNLIIKNILKKSKNGTKVVWIVGNHDEFLRPHLDDFEAFGNIEIVNEYAHMIDGKKFWIVHGDEFDVVTRYHKWIAVFGDWLYTVLLWTNRHYNNVRAQFGFGYWSLSQYLKHKVKSAVNFIFEFENSLAHECKRKGFDGVICGHIHHAEIKDIDGVTYMNCGDWVESCTALVVKNDKAAIKYSN